MDLILYSLVGAAAGLLSGLIGLGGGLVVVPALTFLYKEHSNAFVASSAVHFAIGTSLALMIFTTISSMWAHHRRKHVDWELWGHWVVFLMLGAIAGAWVDTQLPTEHLESFFAVFLILIAIRLVFRQPPRVASNHLPTWVFCLLGLLLGLLSSMLGIGGGVLMVPLLMFCGLRLPIAVGTAVASTLPIALMGAMGFVLTGWSETLHHTGCLGYIYWPACISMVPLSMLSAPLGAKLSQHCPVKLLQRILAGVLLLTAYKLLC